MPLDPPPPPPPAALPPPPAAVPTIPPPPPHAAPRASAAVRALGAGIAAVLTIAVVAVVGRVADSDDDHPDEWDPRVAELAAFVEDERGLEFDHPVYVDFLTPEEYTDVATSDEADLDDAGRTDLDRLAAQLRALGVASGEVDLFAAFNQVSDSGTFAFYSDGRVQVRGTEMSIGLQATLVHELTHALQDQHFDLDGLLDGVDSSEAIAGRALAEGDALRVEQAWVDELSDEDEAAYDAEYAAAVDASLEGSPDVPGFLQASVAAPYYLGQPFVTMLLNDGGNPAVDEAFDAPPTTEEHLFDPASFLLGEEGDAPDLDLDVDEEDLFEEDTFGSPAWFLVLAERMDPLVAFEAALGWAGDRYAVFERDGRTCTRAVFRGDTDEDEAQMASALDAWAAALPGGQARAIEVDGRPGLDACDPGTGIEMAGAGRAADALAVPALFGYIEAAASAFLEPEDARCVGRRIIGSIPYEQLVDPEGEFFSTAAFDRLQADAYSECGSGER
jgi:hypothetical protein